MDKPLVSVILPVFNGEKFLAEALASVLKQDYRPLEIILVDDGSTDHTARVAARFGSPMRYFYQPNTGPAAARNLGIRMAKGEFIAFIDADDLWPEGKLTAQMRVLKAFPKAGIVQGLIRMVKLQVQPDERLVDTGVDFPYIYSNLGAMVIRRVVFEEIGAFDAGLRFHEDTDFWLRAREIGVHILVHPRTALLYRIHGNNLTRGTNIRTNGFLTVLHKSITRRRKSSGLAWEVAPLSSIPGLRGKTKLADQEENFQSLSWPLISIILFGSGNPESARRAVASISQQEYPRLELLVAGSGLSHVVEQASGQFERLELISAGPDLASTLNAAVEKSCGDWIAFLDSEGEWREGKLKSQAGYLMSHSGDGFVLGKIRLILLPEIKYPAGLIGEYPIRKNLGDPLSTLLVRRSTFSKAGSFRASTPGAEAIDWLLRAMDCGIPYKTLPGEYLFLYIYPDSREAGYDRIKAALLGSVRLSINRKRSGE